MNEDVFFCVLCFTLPIGIAMTISDAVVELSPVRCPAHVLVLSQLSAS